VQALWPGWCLPQAAAETKGSDLFSPNKTLAPQRSSSFIICLLGALSVFSPFAIDMYLPAFQQLGKEFSVSGTTVSLTVSSYFVGMALGQVFYGPLLDRFGRKQPLLWGLGLFFIASLGCACTGNVHQLIVLRFFQALGGSAAGVASLAMVHDFFPVQDGARILSRLILFIAVSPLLAPSIGGLVMQWVGWRAVFVILAVIVAVIFALIYFSLPESHAPDASISLKPLPITLEYLAILRHPRFATYALAGAFSFAGLFTYVAGSPTIFMDGFHLSPQVYSGIFAMLAVGFVGGSQVNVLLLRKFTSGQIFSRVLMVQMITSLVFVAGAMAHWYGLAATLALFFVFLSCAGLTYPNAAALALAPFSKNAGSASAMLGFLQLGIGSLISTGISMASSKDSFPIIALLAITTVLGLIIFVVGRKRADAIGSEEENCPGELGVGGVHF
jgi:MFS transporter, DHA1 family, multidrug resistance protein